MKSAIGGALILGFTSSFVLAFNYVQETRPKSTSATPQKVEPENMTKSTLTDARPMCFIATSKPEESKAFYSDVLGLKFIASDPISLSFVINKDVQLRIQKVKDVKPHPFTAFGWQVDDIEVAVSDLAKRGLAFEKYGFPSQDERGVCTFPNGDKVAWFKDPDGNTLSIAQLVGKHE